jgi:8-oxo-dGTP pyrophosphatase MutT (NUDIX family)
MYKTEIENYVPSNEEEAQDKKAILQFIERNPDCLLRDNLMAHMTTSAWIVNEKHDKILMCFHNIYNSWSWIGGHADGDDNLLRVALKEAKEESGISNFKALDDKVFSIECLYVLGHYKRGKYVNCHQHLNVTYLLEANEEDTLKIKPDENKGLAWFSFDEVLTKPTEPWMIEHVYKKLIEKTKHFFKEK